MDNTVKPDSEVGFFQFTEELCPSYHKLAEHLSKKHGVEKANTMIQELARHFKETLDDHVFAERLASGKTLASLLNNVSFKS